MSTSSRGWSRDTQWMRECARVCVCMCDTIREGVMLSRELHLAPKAIKPARLAVTNTNVGPSFFSMFARYMRPMHMSSTSTEPAVVKPRYLCTVVPAHREASCE
jgi:hypothetical protein